MLASLAAAPFRAMAWMGLEPPVTEEEMGTRSRSRAVTATQAPKISKDFLEKAIQTYAPVLAPHKDEKYRPTCVESYLGVTEGFDYVDRDDKKTYRGLRLKGSDPNLRAGDPAKAKVYVNVKVGDKTTDLQYWFLYAYNGPGTAYLKKLALNMRYEAIGDYELGEMGIHEGDWEHITVRIDNKTGKATPTDSLYMAAHDSGGSSDVEKAMVDCNGQRRLKVYASKNGHATYLEPERHYNATVKAGLVEFRLLNDAAAPDSNPIDYRGRCEVIGIQGDPVLRGIWGFTPQPWIATYPGRWGKVMEKPHPYATVPVMGTLSEKILKAVGAFDELTFEAGPQPPWAKGSWTGPE
jgi:hypothetical protein